MPVPMTVEGADALRQELQHCKTTKRQEISKAIAEAREHGDLKENAEYHAAREQGGFNEGRIQHIESTLADRNPARESRFIVTGTYPCIKVSAFYHSTQTRPV